MRVDLKVPFEEKDQARKLGARWDAARKVWYIENKEDLEPFIRWMPQHLTKPHAASTGTKRAEVNAPPSRSAKPAVRAVALSPTGGGQAGRDYKPFSCNCSTPPWELCPGCPEQAAWLASTH